MGGSREGDDKIRMHTWRRRCRFWKKEGNGLAHVPKGEKDIQQGNKIAREIMKRCTTDF